MEPDVLECRCSFVNHDGGLQVRQFRTRAAVDSGAEGQTVGSGPWRSVPSSAVQGKPWLPVSSTRISSPARTGSPLNSVSRGAESSIQERRIQPPPRAADVPGFRIRGFLRPGFRPAPQSSASNALYDEVFCAGTIDIGWKMRRSMSWCGQASCPSRPWRPSR